MLHRLSRLLLLVMVGAAAAATAPAAAQTIPDGFRLSHALTYRIYRGDDPIGQTAFAFHTRGADHIVVTRTRIDVQVLLYSYSSQHVATETWEGGILTALETRTNDDGDPFRVSGRREADGFRVSGVAGQRLVPPGTPPKSFWNPDILTASHVITTKRGAVEAVRTTRLGRERVGYRGGSADATRYRFETDDKIDLWYTDDGLLVKALRESFGGDILYLLDTTG